ncbi:hypothetical protein ACO0QE_003242 [Hanseniaspora vineae]
MSVTEFNTPQPEHVELNVCKENNSQNTIKTNHRNPMAALLSKESSDLSDSMTAATAATIHNSSSNNLNANSHNNESVLNDTELRSSQGSMGYGTKELLSPPLSPNINSHETNTDFMSSDFTNADYTKHYTSFPSSKTKFLNPTNYLLLTPQSHPAQLSAHPLTHKSAHTTFNDNSFDSIFLEPQDTHKDVYVPCAPDYKISSHKPLVVDLQWSKKEYASDLKFFVSKYRKFRQSTQNGTHMNNRLEKRYLTRSSSNMVNDYTNENTFNGSILTSNNSYSNGLQPVRTYRTRLRTIAEGNKDDEPHAREPSMPQKFAKPPHIPNKTAKPHLSKPHVSHPPLNEWRQMPDYAPPLSSLDNIHNGSSKGIMKVEWKGSTMDLSQDPLRNKLHPAELQLASILRLSCDSYLASKRRLFMEKVSKLKRGQGFRRTDAQKVCRIDVNKASRLYQAFEKVGWLDDKNFVKFL